jgi:hypothetical protein
MVQAKFALLACAAACATVQQGSAFVAAPASTARAAMRSTSSLRMSSTPPPQTDAPPAAQASSRVASPEKPKSQAEIEAVRLRSMAARLRAEAAELEAEQADTRSKESERIFRMFDSNKVSLAFRWNIVLAWMQHATGYSSICTGLSLHQS